MITPGAFALGLDEAGEEAPDLILGGVVATGMRRTLKRYTKFVLVGLLNAFVDLAVLNLLMLLISNHTAFMLVVDNTIAVACAILNSYLLNRRWTFADKTDGSSREGFLFLIQAVINIVLNDWILAWCSTYLVFSRNIPLYFSSNASKGLAMFLSSSVSYLLLRFVVFRGNRKSF